MKYVKQPWEGFLESEPPSPSGRNCNNRFRRLDISDARELVGYAPQDDLTEVNPQLKPLHLTERVQTHNVSDQKEKKAKR